MTYLIPQSELNAMTHAELRLILSQIFNELAKLQQATPSCPLASAAAENIEVIFRRRRKQGPKP